MGRRRNQCRPQCPYINKVQLSPKQLIDLDPTKLHCNSHCPYKRKFLLRRRLAVKQQEEHGEFCHNDNCIHSGNGKKKKKTRAQQIKMFKQLREDICSDSADKQLMGVIKIRNAVCEQDPPIEELIQCDVVPHLIEFLARDENPHLQREAAWALTNMVSGKEEHTEHVIQAGAVPKFVHLLESPDLSVSDQAVWALGNIAGDTLHSRNLVLEHGAMPAILALFDKPDLELSFKRNLVWAISNLCRFKPKPYHILSTALPTLAKQLYVNDEQVLSDVCWCFSYLSDDDSEQGAFIKAVVSTDVCKRLVELLIIQTTALRSVGNIVTGDDVDTQAILDHNPLPSLKRLLSHKSESIRKEAAWTISNITAGPSTHIQYVIDADIISALVPLAERAPLDLKTEAVYAIYNATAMATKDQIEYLVKHGVVAPLCKLLDLGSDGRSYVPMLTIAMNALDNIFLKGQKFPSAWDKVRCDCGAWNTVSVASGYRGSMEEVLSTGFTERLGRLALSVAANLRKQNAGPAHTLSLNCLDEWREEQRHEFVLPPAVGVLDEHLVTVCNSFIKHVASPGVLPSSTPPLDETKARSEVTFRCEQCHGTVRHVLPQTERPHEYSSIPVVNEYASYMIKANGLARLRPLLHHTHSQVQELASKLMYSYIYHAPKHGHGHPDGMSGDYKGSEDDASTDAEDEAQHTPPRHGDSRLKSKKKSKKKARKEAQKRAKRLEARLQQLKARPHPGKGEMLVCFVCEDPIADESYICFECTETCDLFFHDSCWSRGPPDQMPDTQACITADCPGFLARCRTYGTTPAEVKAEAPPSKEQRPPPEEPAGSRTQEDAQRSGSVGKSSRKKKKKKKKTRQETKLSDKLSDKPASPREPNPSTGSQQRAHTNRGGSRSPAKMKGDRRPNGSDPAPAPTADTHTAKLTAAELAEFKVVSNKKRKDKRNKEKEPHPRDTRVSESMPVSMPTPPREPRPERESKQPAKLHPAQHRHTFPSASQRSPQRSGPHAPMVLALNDFVPSAPRGNKRPSRQTHRPAAANGTVQDAQRSTAPSQLSGSDSAGVWRTFRASEDPPQPQPQPQVSTDAYHRSGAYHSRRQGAFDEALEPQHLPVIADPKHLPSSGTVELKPTDKFGHQDVSRVVFVQGVDDARVREQVAEIAHSFTANAHFIRDADNHLGAVIQCQSMFEATDMYLSLKKVVTDNQLFYARDPLLIQPLYKPASPLTHQHMMPSPARRHPSPTQNPSANQLDSPQLSPLFSNTFLQRQDAFAPHSPPAIFESKRSTAPAQLPHDIETSLIGSLLDHDEADSNRQLKRNSSPARLHSPNASPRLSSSQSPFLPWTPSGHSTTPSSPFLNDLSLPAANSSDHPRASIASAEVDTLRAFSSNSGFPPSLFLAGIGNTTNKRVRSTHPPMQSHGWGSPQTGSPSRHASTPVDSPLWHQHTPQLLGLPANPLPSAEDPPHKPLS